MEREKEKKKRGKNGQNTVRMNYKSQLEKFEKFLDGVSEWLVFIYSKF